MSDPKRTLQNVMDSISDDVVVHIGSKTAFFFVGTKAEYEANIDAVQHEIFTEATLRLSERKREAAWLRERIGATAEPCEKEEWAELMSMAGRLYKLCGTIPNIEDFIEMFTPFRTRKVLDRYTRITGWIAIIVSGKEVAKYWDLEEYKNGTEAQDGEESED